jgi:hypothetical protein
LAYLVGTKGSLRTSSYILLFLLPIYKGSKA